LSHPESQLDPPISQLLSQEFPRKLHDESQDPPPTSLRQEGSGAVREARGQARGGANRPALVATRAGTPLEANCLGRWGLQLKVILIRAPLDVEAVGEVACRSWLRNKLGPIESAGCEVTRLSVEQLQSERHGIEVCDLREERHLDKVLGSVRTERRVCHRRSPSAGPHLLGRCVESERLSAQKLRRDAGTSHTELVHARGVGGWRLTVADPLLPTK